MRAGRYRAARTATLPGERRNGVSIRPEPAWGPRRYWGGDRAAEVLMACLGFSLTLDFAFSTDFIMNFFQILTKKKEVSLKSG